MSKVTTTIYELLANEAYKEGFNDFIAPDGMHLISYGDSYALVNKINAYDKDVQKWAKNILFAGNNLTDPAADFFFKKEFVTLFINREIKYQTVDLWRIRLTAEMTRYDQWLSSTVKKFSQVYTNEKDGRTTGNLLANQVNTSNTDFTGKVTTTSDTNTTSTTDTTTDTNTTSTTDTTTDTNNTTRHRDLDATLPQNETSLSLDSDEVTYADSRKDSKDKATGQTRQTSTTKGNQHTTSETDTKSNTEVNANQDTKNNTEVNANQDTKQDTVGTTFDINYDIDTVNKIYRVFDPVFKDLDRKLFLQVW